MYSSNGNYARFSAAPKRHLFGLGVNPFTIQMPNGNENTYSTIDPQIASDLSAGGKPIRPGGGYYTVTMFEGGYLFDNCPLNVILGNGWISGQQAALYAAGLTPNCPQAGPMGVGVSNPPTLAPTAPVTTSPVTPVIPTTFTSISSPGGGAAYVNASPTSGMVTTPATVAPITGVTSATGTAPATAIPGSSSSSSDTSNQAAPTTDNTMMYVGLAVIALILLKSK